MNYQDVINNIRDLGFSDDDEMEEFGDLVPNSINRAITIISLHSDPIIERYDLEITDDDSGYLFVTMPDVDDMFMRFSDTPVLIEKDGKGVYERFNDYELEANDTVVINADKYKGTFRICYVADHEPFTGANSELGDDIPLPRKAHHLVPLLAAYYVWMEDEPTKAAQYYNLYEQENEKMKADDSSKNIRVRVLSGGM